MTNILSLPQLPAWSFVVSVDGDWVDPTIFFPADTNSPPTPFDITGIRFVCRFTRPDGTSVLTLDTADGSFLNSGATGYLSPNSLAATRSPLYVTTAIGSLFAMADGYQIDLTRDNGPISLTIQDDTL